MMGRERQYKAEGYDEGMRCWVERWENGEKLYN